jgi:hypothetical protein
MGHTPHEVTTTGCIIKLWSPPRGHSPQAPPRPGRHPSHGHAPPPP